MTPWNIVVGQSIDAEKLQFARTLRHKMTPTERILWASIRGRRLNDLKFRRQQIVDGYIADFFCSSAGLVIELDGAIHDAQAEYDTNRDLVMSERGLRVIRISNARIETELEAVLLEIAAIATDSNLVGGEDLSPRPPLRNGEGESEFHSVQP